jgi:hypothetical protein
MDALEHSFGVQVFWQRQLNQNPVNGRVSVQSIDHSEQLGLRSLGG